MGAELAEAIAELSQLAGAHPASPGRVTLRSEGRAGSLTLEHPEARNAVSIAMMRDLALAVEAALRAGLDTIVLRGAGAGFCAGGYLPEVRRALVEPEGARAMCAGMTAVLDALSASPALVIAAIDGPAVGGGVELALAADVRVIAPGAWMELRQARLGVTAGWGGAHRLVRRVGPGAALALMAAGERLDAARCLAAGLADQIAADGRSAAEQADAWAARLGEVAPACKAQIAAASRGDRAGEAEAFLSTWGSARHRAAIH